MIIEYVATNQEDDCLFEWMERMNVKWTEAFNPEDNYFILETEDERVPTIMLFLGMEVYIQGEKIVDFQAKL